MKALYDLSIFIIIGIVALCAVVGAISVKYLGDDNVVEETAEDVIKDVSGINIDLSPRSPDKK